MVNPASKKPVYQWLLSLYFIQGLPFALVTTVSTIFYKNLGVTNINNILFTSLLALPWAIKPILAPLLEILSTKKKIIITTQLLMGFACFLLAFSVNLSHFFMISLCFFFIIAVLSTLYDITSDGFYLINLTDKQRAYYVGIRSFCYQSAILMASGLAVMIAGFLFFYLDKKTTWELIFLFFSGLFLLLTAYHWCFLPETEKIKFEFKQQCYKSIFSHSRLILAKFTKLPHLILVILFLIFYNSTQGQLIKIVPLFLLDSHQQGGLQLSTSTVGMIYGSVGVIAIMLGSLCSSFFISRYAIKPLLSTFTLLTIICNLGYIVLSLNQTQNFWVISSVVSLGKFSFGLSNSAYFVYLIKLVSDKEYAMTFYAIGTALMSLGAAIAGILSGYIEYLIGYQYFFIWILFLGLIIYFYTLFFVNRTSYAIDTL